MSWSCWKNPTAQNGRSVVRTLRNWWQCSRVRSRSHCKIESGRAYAVPQNEIRIRRCGMVKATDLRLEPELTEVKDWYLELPNPQKQRFLGAVRIRPDR